MRGVVALVFLLILAVGGYVYFRYESGPEREMQRMERRVEQAAELAAEGIDKALTEGPRVDLVDDTGVFRRIRFMSRASRIDLDAGAGDGIAHRSIRVYTEKNGVDGRQRGDVAISSASRRRHRDDGRPAPA